MSDELEELRKRKLAELQAQQSNSIQKQAQEEEQVQAQIAELENLVKQYLEKDALVRYGNLKVAHTEKAIKVLAVLAQMIKQGRITRKIDDSNFREILKTLEPKKKEFNITRK